MNHPHQNANLSHILYEYGLLGTENAVLASDASQKILDTALQDDLSNDEPVIQFVNRLLNDAVTQLVSDIHLESFIDSCRIRFRRDGLLYESARLPKHFALRIMTRLKIMAQLDISEKRLPQDGRLLFQHKEHIDLRISTCPGIHGEKIVLRILRHLARQHSLHELGMSARQCDIFEHALRQPQGLILVTGPTGSGKTATLYSALQILNQPEKNILTVEDPVEIDVNGMTQVPVNARIGLTFATVLRAFLRQDPDVIMIGEIRDAETAAIALQAAQTGHLVLSTLHTNHAVDTLKRLQTLQITPNQLAGSLILLAAQRLVRKQCPHCERMGCTHCRDGYQGRTGLFEIIPISAQTNQLMLEQSTLTEIMNQLTSEQHENLLESGHAKVKANITTQHELLRVLGDA